jgi:glutamate--cysteine ligase
MHSNQQAQTFEKRLAWLSRSEASALLGDIAMGMEKEGLRVDGNMDLAQTPHPRGLGSALTHPDITTDYAEALLEMVTAVFHTPTAALERLQNLHSLLYRHLDDELLWNASMPARLGIDADIPVAEYGRSSIGRLKTLYRIGLGHRYGRAMQCIAGLHFNFSLPETFWVALAAQEHRKGTPRTLRDEGYFNLLRNFRRFSWLLIYLFGASPVLDRSFLRHDKHGLETLALNSLGLPWATSLRMSRLGYQNNAQEQLDICFNSLEGYLDTLDAAVSTPWPDYEKLGLVKEGQRIQLNTNLLQIENEYYSPVRPKRVAHNGEHPNQALRARGVEYIEVRCLDINPFAPAGIDASTCHFLPVFLTALAILPCPPMTDHQCQTAKKRLTLVVEQGRKPGLLLPTSRGPVPVQVLGQQILDLCEPLAVCFDQTWNSGNLCQAAVRQARSMLDDPAQLPSARLLQQLGTNDSWLQLGHDLSAQARQTLLGRPLPAAVIQAFEANTRESEARQQQLEAESGTDFDAFLDVWLRR